MTILIILAILFILFGVFTYPKWSYKVMSEGE